VHIWCVFGNPLRLDGRFPQCFPGGRNHESWTHFNISSLDVSLSNKESIIEKLAYYGETSNYARSHVYGLFPTASTTQLIPRDWVEAAAVRETVQFPGDPVTLGCDVASGHGENASVIVARRGYDARFFAPRIFSTLDPAQFVYEIAAAANETGATTICVDAGGVGAGVPGRLRELGFPVHGIELGSRSDNPDNNTRCGNKRAEIWCKMAQWLKVGAIPNHAQLKAELVGPSFSENARGIMLERKEDMVARGLASPDIADSLALTFAVPVFNPISINLAGPGDHMVQSSYNPFSDAALNDQPLPESTRKYCAPGWARMKPEWDHPDWTGNDWADAQASDALRYQQQGLSQPAPEPHSEPWPSSGAAQSLWPKLR
jgi:hypothetical protein